MEKCNICNHKKLILVDFNNLILRTDSKNANIHYYKSYICENCGILNQHPQMTDQQLSDHYNSNYRETTYKLKINNQILDFPLKFEQTGISFQRFFHFNKIIENTKIKLHNKIILDYGSYQGSFLYACKKIYNSYTIGYDYNDEGLKFSKKYLGIDETIKTSDIYNDKFSSKPHLCSLIHVFEHLGNPNKFLKHLHDNILNDGGYIYIEVPDINSSHFSDPTHCFTYNAQSLKYVLEKNNFEILALETNKIYGKVDPNIPRKKLQKNLHCLAKKGRLNNFEQSPNQGTKIYNEVKINHNKIYNLYLYQQSKKVIEEFLELIMTFISKIISKFSYNQSINFYEKYKLYLKKILGIFKK